MLDFIKNKAIAAKNYVVDTATETAAWYSDMRVTPREKIAAMVAGIASVGAAWATFTLGFGSAPISLVTLAATPAATTAITGVAVGAGVLAKKAVSGALNSKFMLERPTSLEDISWFSSEYRPTQGPDRQWDHQLKAKYGTIDAQEKKGLLADLKVKTVETFTRPTLFSRGGQPVQYKDLPTYTAAQLNKIPEATTRSGTKFRN